MEILIQIPFGSEIGISVTDHRISKQAEAEVVPSSSLVDIEVEVRVEVQLKCSYIKLG